MDRLKDLLTENKFKRFKELKKKLRTGKIKKWRMENTSIPFDADKAFENFKKITDSDLTETHMKKMKEIYGEE